LIVLIEAGGFYQSIYGTHCPRINRLALAVKAAKYLLLCSYGLSFSYSYLKQHWYYILIADYVPDACLSELAHGVGNDWRRLASQLRISLPDERRHRAGNTAELAVLRAWRDRHLERPSEALDNLRRALSTIRRTDLLKIIEFYVRDVRRSGSDREGPKLVSTV